MSKIPYRKPEGYMTGPEWVSQELLPYDGVQKSRAYTQRYIGIEPGISVRPSFNKKNYTAFRSGESVPSQQKAIMRMAMDAYDDVGIIRHIIDLMSDFASQGMSILHKNKAEENFYKQWFEQIDGSYLSERFLNYFYRIGTSAVRRKMAKISKKQTRKYRAGARNEFDDQSVKKREIPWAYEFLNPLVLDYKENGNSLDLIMNLTNSTYSKTLNNTKIPQDIRSKLSRGQRYITLNKDTVRIFSYKKDDWLMWANPMMRPILDDIAMLEKMKLADMAALDGAISNIRLWKLGSLEHKIMPKPAAMNKLRNILASHVGGGTMDLVWTPDLEFQESRSEVYKFLGGEKYEPALNAIYTGLGIPPALTGLGGAGLTNNHLSLKTLIERLEYGRKALLKFWNYEFKLIQKAMGFKSIPRLHFTNIVLSDEAAIFNLLIHLVDRNIISHETLLERFKEIPEIEAFRLKREAKDREMPEGVKKAGPYHSPEHSEEMAKLALTKDVLNVKEYFDKLGIKTQKPPVVPSGGGLPNKSKPKSGPGRPINTRDTNPRKQRRVIPRSTSTLSVWATNAQKQISDIVTPIALGFYSKKNVRSLTKVEFDELEYLKLCTLANMKPFSDINENIVKVIIEKNQKPSKEFEKTLNFYKSDFIKQCQKEPTIDDLRLLNSVVFAEINQK